MLENTKSLLARSWRGLVLLTAIVSLPLHAATVNVPADFPTIQAAITASAAGGTVQVAAGTYTEQLVISKNLTLTGAGSATTIIQAPASTTTDPVAGGASIVVVNNSATVSMSGFTVKGPGTSCSVSFGVIVYGNATLTFDSNHVTSIRDNPLSGVQCGRAIQGGFASSVGHLIVTNTTVDDYQKNGIVIAGAGSTGTISDSTVTGDGAETTIAQNGIVIIGGATATLNDNTVTGNDCDAAGCGPDPENDTQSGGIFVLNATASLNGNSVSGNDIGLLVINDTSGSGSTSSIEDTFSDNRYENVFVVAAHVTLQFATVGGTSNFAILAIAFAGDVANTLVEVDCGSSIAGTQEARQNNGTVTTATIAHACGAVTLPSSVAPVPVDSAWMLCLLGFVLVATGITRLSARR